MRRILLDTDLAMGGEPGADIDDGFALAFALADPELSVELVTTVNGNTDVDTATRLTLGLLDRLGRGDVPVARGAATPLVGDWTRGGGGIQRIDAPLAGHAAVHIVERVMAEPGELTVVAIGPLTNVALALALEPRVATSVAEIVVMGGVYLEQTNVAAVPGEFNFWADPYAAAEVLDSGAPIRAVGLDVTRRVRLTREHVTWLAESASDFGHFAASCAEGWIAHVEQTTDQRDSCALHDPLAVASVAYPDLLIWRQARVVVETSGTRTRGVAVADLLTTPNSGPPNCRIALDVDAPAFLDLFLGRIATLG
jgi:purine nucleosidase